MFVSYIVFCLSAHAATFVLGVNVSNSLINSEAPNTTETAPQCKLTTTSKNAARNVQAFFGDGAAKLVRVRLTLSSDDFLRSLGKTDMFLPLEWVKTKGSEGQGLLLLKEELYLLSFSILNVGIYDLTVHIDDSPRGCFISQGWNISHFQDQIRTLIMNDFKDAPASTSNYKVCNQHIRDINGIAAFFYVCCYIDFDRNRKCEEVKLDTYTSIFFTLMLVINVLLILYSPMLVPKAWYREKYLNEMFMVKFPSPRPFKIMKTNVDELHQNSENVTVPFELIDEDPDLRTLTRFLAESNAGVVYSFTLSNLQLKLKKQRLIPVNDIPVGIFQTLYDTIIKCEIRDQNAVKDCCYGNICGTTKLIKREIIWHKCLQQFMLLLVLLVVAMPWALRLYFYYLYEDENRELKVSAATAKRLDPNYPGNLLAYFTPIHGIFLFFYCILALDVLLYGILKRKVSDQSKFIVRKCFRDMHSLNKSRAIGYCIHILLIPVKKFGIFFLLIAWIYWLVALPQLLLVFAFYFMPLVNILCNLLFTYIEIIFPVRKLCSPVIRSYQKVYKKISKTEEKIELLSRQPEVGEPKRPSTRTEKALTMVVSCILIISILSFTVLALEFLIAVVEFIIYQIIGLILNWGSMLKYVALVFILILYGRDCFNSVDSKYKIFYEKLMAYMKTKASEQLKDIIVQSVEEQENTGLQIFDEETSDRETSIELKLDGKYLQWDIPRLVLFVDKYDVFYITKSFFFACSEMSNAGCPGSLMYNLLSAFSQFVKILLFLLFVILVIAAFGERYEVSGINQTFLAAAGGILPWVFKNLLFKSPPSFDLDTDSPVFQKAFSDLVKDYVESADAYDIDPKDDLKETDDRENIDLVVYHQGKESNGPIELTII